MSWTDIVNKRSKSWWIVQNNQPAGSGEAANAVPDVDDWSTLSDGKQSGYRFPLKRNPKREAGVETPVIDIEYVLRWEYGNQYRRKGMFLRTIWTDVTRCDVKDGFDVSIWFACGDPWNDNPSGNPPWPAAMINIDMNVKITTPKWQKTLETGRYYLQYNGNLVTR
jgi:hypothetical protein